MTLPHSEGSAEAAGQLHRRSVGQQLSAWSVYEMEQTLSLVSWERTCKLSYRRALSWQGGGMEYGLY